MHYYGIDLRGVNLFHILKNKITEHFDESEESFLSLNKNWIATTKIL